jgi:hypothetical protein
MGAGGGPIAFPAPKVSPLPRLLLLPVKRGPPGAATTLSRDHTKRSYEHHLHPPTRPATPSRSRPSTSPSARFSWPRSAPSVWLSRWARPCPPYTGSVPAPAVAAVATHTVASAVPAVSTRHRVGIDHEAGRVPGRRTADEARDLPGQLLHVCPRPRPDRHGRRQRRLGRPRQHWSQQQPHAGRRPRRPARRPQPNDGNGTGSGSGANSYTNLDKTCHATQ